MIKLKKDWIIPETEQTKRMKGYALSYAYVNSGELYRLLDTEVLNKLVVRIKNHNIELKSDIQFGKKVITSEELFLSNLDRYISYVKNHYFVDSIEQYMLIELSLDNKYADVLFDERDFHSEENYYFYFDKFRKMFFFNLYENIMFFKNKFANDSNLYKMSKLLKKYKYSDAEDILTIENILSRTIMLRYSNLVNAFNYYKNINKRDFDFYGYQVEWLVSQYFENEQEKLYKTKVSDNYIKTFNNGILIFNIISDYSKLKNDDEILIEFGYQDKYFTCKKKDYFLRKYELQKLIERLEHPKKIDNYKPYEETLDFIDPSLSFELWNIVKKECLLIRFKPEKGLNYYNIDLEYYDIPKLVQIIKRQMK